MKLIPLCLLAAAVTIGATAPSRAQDATAGAAVFKTQCSLCHAVAAGKNMVGPTLFGIVGRPAAQVPDFNYSAADKASGLTWDTATLDRFVANPQAVVPKTIMPYPGLKDDTKRANLIAYLATLH